MKVKLIPLPWDVFFVIGALVIYIYLQHQEQELMNYVVCILINITNN
jgi:hypothetical protein